MSKIEQGEIHICTLEGLGILSRPGKNGGAEYRVIMTFKDETQRPDPLTDEGYQTVAGPFPNLLQAERRKGQLERKIAELGVNKVVKEIMTKGIV